MSATRTFEVQKPRPLIETSDDCTTINLHSDPLRCRPEGDGACDDFMLAISTWEKIGSPDRITVTVTAAA